MWVAGMAARVELVFRRPNPRSGSDPDPYSSDPKNQGSGFGLSDSDPYKDPKRSEKIRSFICKEFFGSGQDPDPYI